MKSRDAWHLAGQIDKVFCSVLGCHIYALSLQPGITAESFKDMTVGDSLLSILVQKLTLFMPLENTSAQIIFQAALSVKARFGLQNPNNYI